MSLYWQHIQGNISKQELLTLTGVDVDSKEPIQWEYRLVDENNNPISEWMDVIDYQETLKIPGNIEISDKKLNILKSRSNKIKKLLDDN